MANQQPLKPMLGSFNKRPVTQVARTPKLTSLFQQLGSNFSFSTLLLVGACLQSILVLTLPARYALLPACFLLLLRASDSILITLELKSNPYIQDVIPGRATALLPNEEGQVTAPVQNKVAVMMLGAKSNHPLGVFAPTFREVGEHLFKMNDAFDSEPPNGFMGQTSFERKDERGAREFVFISYWRSIEDLHVFAHSGLHRETWLWWEKNLKKMNAVGINHEIYEAQPGAFENVYVNFQPTLLGATSFLKKDGKIVGGTVSEEWIHPLVDARKGKLAKSSARLGWNPTALDAARPAAAKYE
jgi:heme-degrading monooxygenase HmoA